jgi:hypothetical protein
MPLRAAQSDLPSGQGNAHVGKSGRRSVPQKGQCDWRTEQGIGSVVILKILWKIWLIKWQINGITRHSSGLRNKKANYVTTTRVKMLRVQTKKPERREERLNA